ERMVLAERGEADRALDDLRRRGVGAVPALAREGGEQLRVAVVAAGRVVQRPQEPLRGLARTGGVERHPERGEDLRDVLAVAVPVRGRDLARGELERVVQLDDGGQLLR